MNSTIIIGLLIPFLGTMLALAVTIHNLPDIDVRIRHYE